MRLHEQRRPARLRKGFLEELLKNRSSCPDTTTAAESPKSSFTVTTKKCMFSYFFALCSLHDTSALQTRVSGENP